MTLNDYQQQALRTAKDRSDWFARLQEGALGLAGEAGEVADYIKKGVYQGHVLKPDKLVEELGDVLWYVALVADAGGISLDDVARANIDKLWARFPQGFDSDRSIHREGNGDGES